MTDVVPALTRYELAGLLDEYGIPCHPPQNLIDNAAARAPLPAAADLPDGSGEIAVTWDPDTDSFTAAISADQVSYDLGEGVRPAAVLPAGYAAAWQAGPRARVAVESRGTLALLADAQRLPLPDPAAFSIAAQTARLYAAAVIRRRPPSSRQPQPEDSPALRGRVFHALAAAGRLRPDAAPAGVTRLVTRLAAGYAAARHAGAVPDGLAGYVRSREPAPTAENGPAPELLPNSSAAPARRSPRWRSGSADASGSRARTPEASRERTATAKVVP